MFHESPAATSEMSALPGVLGCSFDPFDRLRAGRLPETTLGTGRSDSPCDVLFKYASDPILRYRGIARWHTLLHGLATAIHETSALELVHFPTLTHPRETNFTFHNALVVGTNLGFRGICC